jgi:2-methylcitrate dehydratase PrpD
VGRIVDLQPTTELARFAAGFSYDDLPASAREHARLLLLDGIACALAADFSDEVAPYTKFATTAAGFGDSTLIGFPDRLSLIGATLLNGYLITAVTLCDTYLPVSAHISPEVLPPALAIAERDRADGRALITAFAIGAEVAVRVAAGLNYAAARKRGWHFPGIIGPFGAAAAVGHLRNLTPVQMRNAFGLAGSQAAGTWAAWGTPTVKFHQSRGAVSGLLAGLLAEQDFTASAEILTHPDGGLLTTYSDGGTPEAITSDLGTRFEFEQIAVRLWPGTAPAQSAFTAAFDLMAGRPDFDAIDRVRIDVAPHIHKAHARFVEPQGKFDALLSYHFIVARSLRDGAFWFDSLEPEQVGDESLRRFMHERIEFAPDPDLTFNRCRVTLKLTDGQSLSVRTDAAKGAPDNPATASDLRSKFLRCVEGRLSDSDAAELHDLTVGIHEARDLGRFFTLLGAAHQRRQGP